MVENFRNKLNADIIRISFVKQSFALVKGQLKSRIFNSLNKKWHETEVNCIDNQTLSEIENKSDNDFVEVLIWQPKSSQVEFTVFFTNMSDGWITLLDNYSRQFNEEVISVEFSNEKTDYPIYSFAHRKGEFYRLIRSMKEIDKWEFFEKGNVMKYENINNYKKRRIVKRMNNNIILDYLMNVGISIEVEDFWLSAKATKFWTNLKE